ncbi:MAG TPA: helicase-associated domain-containing protein [Ktedonobacteraceae bacterium]
MLEILNSAPPSEFAAEPAMIYDMAVLINAVYQQKIEPTQAGHIPKRIVNKLRPQLKGQPHYTYDGNDKYTDMIFDLLVEMRILQLTKPPFSDMKPCLEPGPQLTAWSRLDLIEQVKQILKEWTHSRKITDLVGAEFDPMDSYSYYYIMEVRKGRQPLLNQLHTCEPGKWYRVDSLLEELWEKEAGAMRHGSSSKKSRRGDKEAHLKWMKSDGQIYIGMLDSTLRDLGIVALGYEVAPTDEEHPNPTTFMLSEIAATLFSAQEQSTQASVHSNNEQAGNQRYLIIQPSFELLLLQPHLPTLYSVLPFTQVNQIGVASRLTLTKASLLRGMAAGYNIEQIIQALEERSQKELPQNVVYTLRDWARQYKETRVSQVLLLEVSSEDMIAQLCASPKLQGFGIRQLTSFILAVNGDTDLRELRNTLEKEGIAPHLVGNFSNRSSSSSRNYY